MLETCSILSQIKVSSTVVFFLNDPNAVILGSPSLPPLLQGLPKPVIRWLRNGQELTGHEPGVTILEDGTLLILASVSPLDDGEYVCAAANDAGSTERKYQLKVNGD